MGLAFRPVIGDPWASYLFLPRCFAHSVARTRVSRAAARLIRAISPPPRSQRSTSKRVAASQMKGGFGPLLSFEIRGTAADADRIVAAALIIRPGTSFGGVESSWERRARWSSETAPSNLIRLSVGIEAIEDLVTDIDRALATS